MSKYLVSLTLLVFLAAASWSQDDSSDGESVVEGEAGAEAVVAVPETDVADTEEVVDDEDLDVQTYEEDEDDFVPSEEIPADEPIPFPSNI